MTGRYHQGRVASRWQDAWESAGVYELADDVPNPVYVLGMFPYTSGSIHMGHVRNYSITDAYARFRRMQGGDVLHPMGWDAFGLPAENAAHERGVDPAAWTRRCIDRMRQQLRDLGFGYDWTREITTCEPAYYRWNQWLFKRFYEEGLVDYTEATVNWCPDCETVLADAQVEVEDAGSDTRIARPQRAHEAMAGTCWRCATPVEARSLPQWFFRITKYADELADGLDELTEWPSSVRDIQRHWIGRREGTSISFELSNDTELTVFSARPETIHGATYIAASPTHPAVREDGTAGSERSTGDGERWWGRETDITARHPLTDEELPLWVADYVLPEVGTGAVMAVPAHNRQDFQFATAHDLPIRAVVVPEDGGTAEPPFTGDGILQHSGEYDGLQSEVARRRVLDEPAIEPTTTYRLRDWLISRQRYWGTPIPIVHCETCGIVPVPDEELPVTLPSFEPSRGNPLGVIDDFVETPCPSCGAEARRETDTMDTFVDSSWYFLRFLSPGLDTAPYDIDRANEALPVDVYVGGAEHATLHLLYLRFVAKALADMGLLDSREPIRRLITQGTVLHGGRKMSKSVGNVVAPHEYGAETTRLFVLSAAHPARDFEWTSANVTHAYELQQDLHELVVDFGPDTGSREASEPKDHYIEREVDRTIAAVTREMSRFRIHQAIAEVDALASLLRRYHAYAPPNRYAYQRGLRTMSALIAPMAPFLAEELWSMLDEEGLVAAAEWPEPLQPRSRYRRERELVDRLRADVREIIDVAGIGHPRHVDVTIAEEWKFEAWTLARDASDGDAFVESLHSTSTPREDRERYLADLASQVAELEPVLPAERQSELLEQAAWLFDDEFGVTVSIDQAPDGEGVSNAAPNRPEIDIR